MEKNARNVVGVTFQGIHLPMFVSRESPQLDSFIVCSRSYYFHSGMESDPVDTFFMAFYDVFDLDLSAAKDLIRATPLLLHALFLKP